MIIVIIIIIIIGINILILIIIIVIIIIIIIVMLLLLLVVLLLLLRVRVHQVRQVRGLCAEARCGGLCAGYAQEKIIEQSLLHKDVIKTCSICRTFARVTKNNKNQQNN